MAETLKQPTLLIEHHLNVTADRLWELITQADHLAHWWGSPGAGIEVLALEVRPGGRCFYKSPGPGGVPMYGLFEYIDVEAGKRMSFTSGFADADGNIIRAPFGEAFANFPLRIHNTWSVLPNSDGATLRMEGGPYQASDAEQSFFVGMLDGMRQGFAGTLAQLDAYVATL